MAEESKEGAMSKLLRGLPIVGSIMARGDRNERAADAVRLPAMEYHKKYGVMPEKDAELNR